MTTPPTSKTTAHRPLIIGVVGGSGSGKTTIARAIIEASGASSVLLDADSYYKDLGHLPLEERYRINFDHPDSVDFDLLRANLTELAAGQTVKRPTYDFTQHTRSDRWIVTPPADIILAEGILLFADPVLRAMFDIKIFVDVPDDVRFIRRMERDIAERGRSVQDVVRQYLSTVRPMHLEFVEPSKRYADVILPEGGHNRIGVEMVIARVVMDLQRRKLGA